MGEKIWQLLLVLLLVVILKGLGVAPRGLLRYEPAASEAAIVAQANKRLDEARGLLNPLLGNTNQTFRAHVQEALESLPAPELVKNDKQKAIEQLARASSSLDSASGTAIQQSTINTLEEAGLILYEVNGLLLAKPAPSPTTTPSQPVAPLPVAVRYEKAVLLGLLGLALITGLITGLNSFLLFRLNRAMADLKENVAPTPKPPVTPYEYRPTSPSFHAPLYNVHGAAVPSETDSAPTTRDTHNEADTVTAGTQLSIQGAIHSSWALPPLPGSVREFVSQVQGVVVKGGFSGELELDLSQKSSFLLITEETPCLLVPRECRLELRRDFGEQYSLYFDCDNLNTGELWIIAPAQFTPSGKDKWRLVQKGKLEVRKES